MKVTRWPRLAGLLTYGLVSAFAGVPVASVAHATGEAYGTTSQAWAKGSVTVERSGDRVVAVHADKRIRWDTDLGPRKVAEYFKATGSLTVDRVYGSADGGTLVRLKQKARSTPVFGAEIVVHVDERGLWTTAHGEAAESVQGEFPADLHSAKRQAEETAQAHVRQELGARQADELRRHGNDSMWFAPAIVDERGQPHATPAFVVTLSGDLGAEHLVVISASRTDQVLHSEIDHDIPGPGLRADAPARVSPVEGAAATTAIPEKSRGINRVICDARNQRIFADCGVNQRLTPVLADSGSTGSAGDDAKTVFEHLGELAAYYRTYRRGGHPVDLTGLIGTGRDRYGKAIRAVVRACSTDHDYPCPMDNAFWLPATSTMYFGEKEVDRFLVGHEGTHGVIQHTSNISDGALHEHLSDVMGVGYLRAHSPAGTDLWRLRTPSGEVFRDMANPPSLQDPDRLTRLNPKQGDHAGAGVGNKTAYLVAEGTTKESGGSFNGKSFRGIGIDKMLQLWWAALIALPQTADYRELGRVLHIMCDNFVKAKMHSLRTSDCSTVTAATAATEIGSTRPRNAVYA